MQRWKPSLFLLLLLYHPLPMCSLKTPLRTTHRRKPGFIPQVCEIVPFFKPAGERETSLPSLVPSPAGCNARVVQSQEPGAFFWVSYMNSGTQGLEPFSTVFPGHEQRAGSELGQSGLEPGPTTGRGLAYSTVIFTLLLFVLR